MGWCWTFDWGTTTSLSGVGGFTNYEFYEISAGVWWRMWTDRSGLLSVQRGRLVDCLLLVVLLHKRPLLQLYYPKRKPDKDLGW